MVELLEKSAAFQQARLKSERRRIIILLSVIGAGVVLRSLRMAIRPSLEHRYLWPLTILLAAVFVAYECLQLRAVSRAIQNGRDLGRGKWIGITVLETCIPALSIVVLPRGRIHPLSRPLADPMVHLFFIFIILSTLRLNPALCRLAGLVAAVSYLGAAIYFGWRPMLGAPLLSAQQAVFSFAIAFVVSGFVAGAVAGEIRKHVEAALREAELQRQVERLNHDLEIARSIQQSLLPTSTPQMEGFEIAGGTNRRTKPAGIISIGMCSQKEKCW